MEILALSALAYWYIGVAHMVTDLSAPPVHAKLWVIRSKGKPRISAIISWPFGEIADFQRRYGRSMRVYIMSIISSTLDLGILIILLWIPFHFFIRLSPNLLITFLGSFGVLIAGYLVIRPISSVLSAMLFGIFYAVFNIFIPFKPPAGV